MKLYISRYNVFELCCDKYVLENNRIKLRKKTDSSYGKCIFNDITIS